MHVREVGKVRLFLPTNIDRGMVIKEPVGVPQAAHAGPEAIEEMMVPLTAVVALVAPDLQTGIASHFHHNFTIEVRDATPGVEWPASKMEHAPVIIGKGNSGVRQRRHSRSRTRDVIVACVKCDVPPIERKWNCGVW